MNIKEDNIKAIIDASNKRTERYIIITSIVMFIYGLLLPQGWETKFGYLAEPIILARKYIPSIDKLAQASTIPELVRGFLGMSVIVSIILSIFMIIHGAPAERIKNAFYKKNWKEIIESFFIGYLLSPLLLVLLWFFYEYPFGFDINKSPCNWGCNVIKAMLTSRYWLAFCGAILTDGIGIYIFILFVIYFGPLILFIKWSLKRKR